VLSADSLGILDWFNKAPGQTENGQKSVDSNDRVPSRPAPR